MRRRIQANTVDGALSAMRNASAAPIEPPEPLSAAQRRIWDAILLRRGREEWQPVDLPFVLDLTEVICRLREEKKALHKEGFILETDKGPRQNPRAFVVRSLNRQSMELARYLRVHPASDAEEPTRVTAIRDRKSTRLNSSQLGNSYAVLCLK